MWQHTGDWQWGSKKKHRKKIPQLNMALTWDTVFEILLKVKFSVDKDSKQTMQYTRPCTVLSALTKLPLLSTGKLRTKTTNNKGVIAIHFVGSALREGRTLQETQDMFATICNLELLKAFGLSAPLVRGWVRI